MATLQALILAAGSSRRFPANKLLRPLPDQSCLLDRSYQLAKMLTPQVLVVINSDPQMQAYCRAHQLPFVINHEAHTGIASSIACGVTATATAEGWAIFLADMPTILATTLQLLAQTWSAHEVTLPCYQRQHGHPVIFSKHWLPKLRSLHGDQGARALLQDNPAVHYVTTDDAGVCFDIDTEADWETFLRTLPSKL
jgi:molybdenum cofactor cytidylyltransferase